VPFKVKSSILNEPAPLRFITTVTVPVRPETVFTTFNVPVEVPVVGDVIVPLLTVIPFIVIEEILQEAEVWRQKLKEDTDT
jgi:hypothetical protein